MVETCKPNSVLIVGTATMAGSPTRTLPRNQRLQGVSLLRSDGWQVLVFPKTSLGWLRVGTEGIDVKVPVNSWELVTKVHFIDIRTGVSDYPEGTKVPGCKLGVKRVVGKGMRWTRGPNLQP
jgi:hypothetical protein